MFYVLIGKCDEVIPCRAISHYFDMHNRDATMQYFDVNSQEEKYFHLVTTLGYDALSLCLSRKL